MAHRAMFATSLVWSLLAGPALEWVLAQFIGEYRAQHFPTLIGGFWLLAFPIAGAVAGSVIAGRRGAVGFSIAFAVFEFAAYWTIVESIHIGDVYAWRRYQRVLDLVLFNLAFPLTFGAMGGISAGVIAWRWEVALAVAAACAMNGVGGGVILSAVIMLPFAFKGYPGGIALLAPVAISAFLIAGTVPTRVGRDGLQGAEVG